MILAAELVAAFGLGASLALLLPRTGALMAIARYVLKTLPGIDRPAICATLPALNGATHVLDLGANVDSSSEELFRFAVMGSVLASAIENGFLWQKHYKPGGLNSRSYTPGGKTVAGFKPYPIQPVLCARWFLPGTRIGWYWP